MSCLERDATGAGAVEKWGPAQRSVLEKVVPATRVLIIMCSKGLWSAGPSRLQVGPRILNQFRLKTSFNHRPHAFSGLLFPVFTRHIGFEDQYINYVSSRRLSYVVQGAVSESSVKSVLPPDAAAAHAAALRVFRREVRRAVAHRTVLALKRHCRGVSRCRLGLRRHRWLSLGRRHGRRAEPLTRAARRETLCFDHLVPLVDDDFAKAD